MPIMARAVMQLIGLQLIMITKWNMIGRLVAEKSAVAGIEPSTINFFNANKSGPIHHSSFTLISKMSNAWPAWKDWKDWKFFARLCVKYTGGSSL
jgi:hypothetical protein